MWGTFDCASAKNVTFFIISIAVLENGPPDAGLQKRATFFHSKRRTGRDWESNPGHLRGKQQHLPLSHSLRLFSRSLPSLGKNRFIYNFSFLHLQLVTFVRRPLQQYSNISFAPQTYLVYVRNNWVLLLGYISLCPWGDWREGILLLQSSSFSTPIPLHVAISLPVRLAR
jgi:hypothetical protein